MSALGLISLSVSAGTRGLHGRVNSSGSLPFQGALAALLETFGTTIRILSRWPLLSQSL